MNRRHSESTSGDERPPVGARSIWALELWLIAGITFGGAVLRVWKPSHMAVEHFDEGVYASNLYCAFLGGAYPFRHLYAPPLLPVLLEWALILSGGDRSAVMWINVAAGSIMVPSVWWVARTWFGPGSGLAAAGLAAVSAIHAQYSRASLTDCLLCLWLLWGVFWAWRGILDGRPSAMILAAVFACLAWWTKYNGWLTLAISGSGALAWRMIPVLGVGPLSRIPVQRDGHTPAACGRAADRETEGDAHSPSGAPAWRDADGPSFGRVVLRWVLIAVIAILGWLPVPASLQAVGGYAAVADNHAKYFVGPAGWSESFARQAANLGYYHLRLGVLSALLAVAATALVGPTSQRGRNATDSLSAGTGLAGWMLSSWLVGLLVAVPMYTPYPRLTLPWVVAVWLAAGWLLAHWIGKAMAERVDWLPSRWRLGLALAVLAVAVLVQGVVNDRNGVSEDRRRFARIAGEILWRVESSSEAHPGEAVVISVVGEPALFYHLAAESQERAAVTGESPVILPAGDYAMLTSPRPQNVQAFIVTGDDLPGELESSVATVGEWDRAPSRLVLLDEYGPAAVEQIHSLPRSVIRLVRVRP